MCITNGKLNKRVITSNNPGYPLDGMINPTFTNVGASSVYIDEELIASGESFKVDAPGILLTGKIAVNFVSNIPSERKVVVRFVSV